MCPDLLSSPKISTPLWAWKDKVGAFFELWSCVPFVHCEKQIL